MSLIRKLSSAMSLDRSGASSPRVHPADDTAADAAAAAAGAAEAGTAAAVGSSGSSDVGVTVVVHRPVQQNAPAPSAPPQSLAVVASTGGAVAMGAAASGSADAEAPPISAFSKKAGLRISFAELPGSHAAGASPGEHAAAGSKGPTGAAAPASAPPRKSVGILASVMGEWQQG